MLYSVTGLDKPFSIPLCPEIYVAEGDFWLAQGVVRCNFSFSVAGIASFKRARDFKGGYRVQRGHHIGKTLTDGFGGI